MAHQEQRAQQHDMSGMALSATLHCLTGCAIGELAGMVIGTAAGLSTVATIAVSVSLAFFFGYALSTMPLLRAGLAVGTALTLVLAADTLSILTMEIVDNAVMALVPGAMGAGLANPTFWMAMMLAFAAAFAAAYPVNKALLARGKGHALTHGAEGEESRERLWVPAPSPALLAGMLVAFMLGALLVSAVGGSPSH